MIVLDAAALVDAVLDQPSKAWVLNQLTGQDVCAPAHQPAEVLSAVARLLRADQISWEIAHGALAEAQALVQELVPPSVAHLAWHWICRTASGSSTGCTSPWPQDRGCPLVTTDGRLRRAAPPCEVRVPD